nr:hypothetical protein [Anaerolineae bacterium]
MNASIQARLSTRRDGRLAISTETAIVVTLLIVSLFLRFIALDSRPFSIEEADTAMAAWDLVHDSTAPTFTAHSPLLYALTSLSMALGMTSRAALRFWSAAGSMGLVMLPLLYRSKIGGLPALSMMAILALSPIAVFTARQADGIALAVTLFFVALTLFEHYARQRMGWLILFAGASLGAAATADYTLLLPAIAGGLGGLYAYATDDEGQLTSEQVKLFLRSVNWGLFAAGFAASFFLVSTVFFISPGRLGDAADLIARFINGLAHRLPETISPLYALVLYEPFLSVMGLIGTWSALQSTRPWMRIAGGWTLSALAISLLYQGATPSHALWVVIPLAVMAASAIGSLLDLKWDCPWWTLAAQVTGITGLAAMIFAGFIQHIRSPYTIPFPVNAPPEEASFHIPVDLLLAILWLLLLAILLFSILSIWGQRTAIKGTGLAFILIGIAVMTGQSVKLAFPGVGNPYEPINSRASQAGLDMLGDTIEEIGKLTTGYPYDIGITTELVDSTVAWELRAYNRVTYVNAPSPDIDTVLVVTRPTQENPYLGSSYVGQDFVIHRYWKPTSLSLTDYLIWLIYRTPPLPATEDRVILWVREDIFRLVQAGGVPER